MSDGRPKKRSFTEWFFPAIFRRVRKIGLRIEPFLTVREGETTVDVDDCGNAFKFSFLTEENIEELVRFEPGIDRDMLAKWFRDGLLCFGVLKGSNIIAKMWCDLEEFNFPPNLRKLEDDEAYLFAAYAHPGFRGQNLAPLMRTACYASLREIGRSRFYSYTDYYNIAARRFKEKLGARNEALRLHIVLFSKWSKTFTLRRYS